MRFLTPAERARVEFIGNALCARSTLGEIERWRGSNPTLAEAAAKMHQAYLTDDDDLPRRPAMHY